MIIVSIDANTVVVGIDNEQAKLMVEVLRRVGIGTLIEASTACQKHGFPAMASDAQTACSAFASVVGQWTDRLRRVNEEPAKEAPPLTPEEPPKKTEEGEEAPKPTVH